MKKLTAFILCVLLLFLSIGCPAESASDDTEVPTFGLKAGMSLDEIREIITALGFTCVDEDSGTDEAGMAYFSITFTGDVMLFGFPVSLMSAGMQSDGDMLTLHYHFYSAEYTNPYGRDYGELLRHENIDNVYTKLYEAMDDSYERYPSVDRTRWQEGLKTYDLDKGRSSPGHPATFVRLTVTSFEKAEDPE